MFRLLDDPALRGAGDPRAGGLQRSRDAADRSWTATPTLSPAERDDAIATMASRPAWAAALLDAIRTGTIPRRDVNTTIARQILAFDDPEADPGARDSPGARSGRRPATRPR